MSSGKLIEHLIVIANARGMRMDFGQPLERERKPGESTYTEAPRRRDAGERGAGDPGIPGVLTATGRQTATSRAPQWTRDDLSHAALGMPHDYWCALLWCLNGDPKARHHCKTRLLEHALELKERQSWPNVIRRGDCAACGFVRCNDRYVEDLVTMALTEGTAPHAYPSEAARARDFGLSERHWKRAALPGYHQVVGRLNNWYLCGWRYLGRRLADRETAAQTGT